MKQMKLCETSRRLGDDAGGRTFLVIKQQSFDSKSELMNRYYHVMGSHPVGSLSLLGLSVLIAAVRPLFLELLYSHTLAVLGLCLSDLGM